MGSLVLLGVVVVVALFLAEEPIERRLTSTIEERFARATGGTIEIGDADVSWWRLAVEVRDVSVTVPAEDGVAPPMTASAARARVSLAVRGLLALSGRRIHLSDVEVDGLAVGLDQAFVDALPRSSGERPALDVRADRVRVRDGAFRYDDREIPVEVDARDVAVVGEWGSYRRSLVGRVSAAADLTLDLFREPYPVRASASFRLSATRLELFDGVASAPGVEVELDEQTVSWDRGTLVSASARARADLAILATRMTSPPEGLAGRASGDVSWSMARGPVQVRGALEARNFRIGPFAAPEARVDLTYDPGRLRFDVIDARTLGGSVRGRVDLEIAGPAVVDLDLAGRDVTVSGVLRTLDLPMPFSGAGSAELRFRGQPDRPATWTASGRFTMAPVAPTPGRVAVAGDGTVKIDRGSVVVAVPEARLGGARLDVRVEQSVVGGDGRVRLTGRTEDARRTQRATFAILDALEVELPEILETPLAGSGDLDADIGIADDATLALDLDLVEGVWGEDRFRRLSVATRVEPGHVRVPQIEAIGDDWIVRAALDVDTVTGSLVRADGEVVDLPVDLALRRAEIDAPELGGTMTGAVVVERRDGELEGTGRVRLRDVVWNGERVDEAEAAFVASEGRAVFTDLSAVGPALRIEGDLDVDLAQGGARLSVEDGRIELGRLQAVQEVASEVDARLAVSGVLDLTRESVLGTVALRGDDWSLGDRALPALDGSVSFVEGGVRFDLAAREGATWSVGGEVGWSEDLPLVAELRLRRLGVDLAADPDAPSGWALLSGDVSVRGPAAAPEDLIVEGSLDEVEVHVGTRRLRASEAIPIRYDSGRLDLGPIRLVGRGSDLAVELAMEPFGDTLDARVRGYADLGVFTALVPDTTASGKLDVDLAVVGSRARPVARGRFSVSDGRLRFLGFDQAFESIALDVEVADGEAVVRNVRTILGGGEIRGSGGILLDGVGIDSYRLDLQGSNVRVSYPEYFRAVYEGSLVLRGDASSAELGGDLFMLRGEYTQPVGIATLLGSGTREYSADAAVDLPARVFLDIDLRADGNVWVRNDLIETEADFELQVGGDLRRPEVLGRIRGFEGGEIRFRDVDYRIDTATVDFLDLDRIDPYLNLQASTTVREYDVTLRVEGRVDRFDYELTSNPALSQQDIIALLTTGSTLQELTARGGGRAFTGDVAANYFAGALTERFERQLQDVLRVERLQISPLLVRGSGDPTARVTVGKEVTDDLLLIYSSEFGGTENQLYQIEWRASRKIRFTAERDTLGGIGGEILYSDHFWWRRPPTPDYSGSRRREQTVGTATSFVGSLRIEGVPGGQIDDVRGRVPIQTGDPYRRSVLFEGSQRIRSYYVDRGRLEARVAVEGEARGADGDLVDVTYVVDPGPRVSVEIAGVTRRQEKKILKRLRDLWVDTVFTDELFVDAEREIRTYWQERGHYAVEVVPEIGDLDDGRRKVRYEVDPGPTVRVASVAIEGNREIGQERVEKQLLTGSGGALSRPLLVPSVLDGDVAAIRNLYRDQGFLDVRVRRPEIRLALDGGSADVKIVIEEGERTRLARVSVPEVPEGFSEGDLLEAAGLAVGDVFSPKMLIESESRLRASLDRRGYPDARVEANATRDGDGIRIDLAVAPGSRKIVGDVRIEGNFTTKNRIVTRELALDMGDPISREAMLRTQHALYRLGIFRSVRIDHVPMDGDDPERHALRIRVEEAPPFGVTIGVGYDSEAKVKASFGASHANVGGRDRTLSIQGRISDIEERVQFLAEEPRLFGRRLPTLLTVLDETRERPEFTEDRTATAVRVEKELDPRWTAYLRYNFQRVDLLDVQPEALATLQEERLEDISLGDVGFALIRDTRDDPFLTRNGSRFGGDLRWFAGEWLSEADFVKGFAEYSRTRTLRGGHAFAGAVRVGGAVPYGDTVEVPLSERFFAGGDSTLRGFGRDEVDPAGGEALFLVNAEWRFPVWGALHGVVFYDAGNVYPEVGDLDPTDLRHVLGAGLRVETPIGPLRFEYGRKLDRERGESSGEFFVAIGSAF